MKLYKGDGVSSFAVQSKGTNLQEVEAFMGGKCAYGALLKIGWSNGEVKVKTRYGWLTIPVGANAWIVKGVEDDYYVMSDDTFQRIYYEYSEAPLCPTTS